MTTPMSKNLNFSTKINAQKAKVNKLRYNPLVNSQSNYPEFSPKP